MFLDPYIVYIPETSCFFPRLFHGYSTYYLLYLRFVSEGRSLIPCFTHALAQTEAVELPFDVKEAIFECLVAKAGLGKDYCQRDLLEARQLLNGDERLPQYLEAAIAH